MRGLSGRMAGADLARGPRQNNQGTPFLLLKRQISGLRLGKRCGMMAAAGSLLASCWFALDRQRPAYSRARPWPERSGVPAGRPAAVQ
jgi:hypothetical protein